MLLLLLHAFCMLPAMSAAMSRSDAACLITDSVTSSLSKPAHAAAAAAASFLTCHVRM
jgi:hypothetical protein